MNVPARHGARRPIRIATLALLVAQSAVWGCALVGTGEGWVVGSMHAEDCNDDEPLYKEGDFDLGADFFVADPLVDTSDAKFLQRNSISIRIQQTSNRIEQTDSMLIHIHDVEAAAQAFARGDPVPTRECFDLAGCASGDLVLRAQLNLYNRCPGNRAALTASSGTTEMDPSEEGCFRPVAGAFPGCPALGDAERQALQQLCEGDFGDRSGLSEIERLLAPDTFFGRERTAGNACVFFCGVGDARRGQNEDELRGFEIDYGDEISAIFAFNLMDARALQIDTCANGRGVLAGMFKFPLVRSRAAQAFP